MASNAGSQVLNPAADEGDDNDADDDGHDDDYGWNRYRISITGFKIWTAEGSPL